MSGPLDDFAAQNHYVPMSKTVNILDLKPTQFAVGMLEVETKVDEIRELSKKQLRRFVRDNPITVVIAPNKEYYIVDGHHHTSACWQAGLKKLKVRVIEDFSRKRVSYKKFWHKMHKEDWCHPYDKFGDGPRLPMYLPHDIRGLSDDPYRSLAWLVRKKGGYTHTHEPFSEFKWANFFRHHKVFEPDFDLDYSKAVQVALKLARTPGARKLPGYTKA